LVPGYSGTRPMVALTPHRPQKLAGMRTDPPPSLPSENGPMPAATAAPDPADEPPEVRSRRHGLAVGSASGVCPSPRCPDLRVPAGCVVGINNRRHGTPCQRP
jgi:hypothetical protein